MIRLRSRWRLRRADGVSGKLRRRDAQCVPKGRRSLNKGGLLGSFGPGEGGHMAARHGVAARALGPQ